MEKKTYNFADFEKIIEQLRSENGCPWDKEQTHQTLKNHLVEESYEAIEAVDLNDMTKLREELGDVLLLIMLHSQIAKEEGAFTIDDVVDVVSKKMISRHAHVFGDVIANSKEEALQSWNDIKNKEKGLKKGIHVLEDIPTTLPGLMRSYEIQDKAAKVGFDWDSSDGPFDKTREEIEEFLEAVKEMDQDKKESEMGDILFSLVNVCRFMDIDPEIAVQRTNRKFIQRFEYMENKCEKRNLSLKEMKLNEMDKIWEEAKDEIG